MCRPALSNGNADSQGEPIRDRLPRQGPRTASTLRGYLPIGVPRSEGLRACQSGQVSTWNSPEKVDEYTRRIGVVPQRLAGEAVLGEIMPKAPQRALDLGCGDGRLAGVILDTRPGIEEIVAVDASPPMLERARSRFADEPA
jgi:SAM-dependent methyltransferase